MGEDTNPGCLAGSAEADFGVLEETGWTGGGSTRGDDRGAVPRNPHALSIALEFDLGKPGLVQEACEFADQIVIDAALLLVVFLLAGHDLARAFVVCGRTRRRFASPSIAST